VANHCRQRLFGQPSPSLVCGRKHDTGNHPLIATGDTCEADAPVEPQQVALKPGVAEAFRPQPREQHLPTQPFTTGACPPADRTVTGLIRVLTDLDTIDAKSSG